MTLDLLCKVVDNFGDIGVAYRLARALSEADPDLGLRFVVDDLAAFACLRPGIDPGAGLQASGAWTVVRWNDPGEEALDLYRRERPREILECFACGRPEWMEELLFDPADPEPRRILNVEHLTAESWAEDFHLLPAATRSPLVKKYFFMPGFAAGTGGLIVDRRFRESRELLRGGEGRASGRRALLARLGGAPGPGPAGDLASAFWIPIFSYEREYRSIVADLAAFARDRPTLALVAAGRSAGPFLAAWRAAGEPFPALALPFLPQEDWDEVLLAADFSIVRGEESLARAALSGRPFLWHAYLQDENHQLVKVKALLEAMKPHFPPQGFEALERLWLDFNDRLRDEPAAGGSERLSPLLARLDDLAPGFASFAEGLLSRGDLAERLLSYLRANPLR